MAEDGQGRLRGGGQIHSGKPWVSDGAELTTPTPTPASWAYWPRTSPSSSSRTGLVALQPLQAGSQAAALIQAASQCLILHFLSYIYA